MTTSMTRRQFVARVLGTSAIMSSCTALAVPPKATPDVSWSPTFIVTVPKRDVLVLRSWQKAFERKLLETDCGQRAGDFYEIHGCRYYPGDAVWCVEVSVCRFSEGLRHAEVPGDKLLLGVQSIFS